MSGDDSHPPILKLGPVWTLLSAVQNRDIAQVQDSLDQGADVNSQNFDASHMSVLHYAVNGGNADIVKTLLRWGANPNAATIRGYTPLHSAIELRHPKVTDLLLDYGANPDNRTKSGTTELGETLLHSIVKRQDAEGVQRLLMAGADPFVKNKDGKTPLQSVSGVGSFSSYPPSLLSALEMTEGLPQLPPQGELKKSALFEKDGKGKCLLDNPATWRKLPEVLSRLKTAGEAGFTKAELMQEGANGYTYMERAAQGHALGTLVADFNGRGESFTVQEIIEGKGMRHLAASDQLARAVFTPENTLNWKPAELRSNLALLAEDTRGAVKNLSQLSLAASRNSPGLQGIGR